MNQLEKVKKDYKECNELLNKSNLRMLELDENNLNLEYRLTKAQRVMQLQMHTNIKLDKSTMVDLPVLRRSIELNEFSNYNSNERQDRIIDYSSIMQ